jgi:hypothetical protein
MRAPKQRQQLQQLQDAPQPPPHDVLLQAHTSPDCLCVSFDPCHEHRLATGGADGFVYVLDRRALDTPLHQLRLHGGAVAHVAWSSARRGLLATAGEDGVVLLWDAARLGPAGSAAQGLAAQEGRHRGVASHIAELGQQGLVWAHGGHMSPVSALALHPSRPWLVASASEQEVCACDSGGKQVVVQRRHCMLWEVNRAGISC